MLCQRTPVQDSWVRDELYDSFLDLFMHLPAKRKARVAVKLHEEPFWPEKLIVKQRNLTEKKKHVEETYLGRDCIEYWTSL